MDDMLDGGNTYCYRILAEFAFTSPGGNSYNRVVGLPSEEKCIQLKRDLPFITKVSVINTNSTQGSIQIKWLMPDPNDLDTIKNRGPYRMVLFGAEGLNPPASAFNAIPGASFSSDTYAGIVDTSFTHTGLNTVNAGFSYKLQFYAGNLTIPYGNSYPASSVFLSAVSLDRTVRLSWDHTVPWINFNYEIYRSISGGPFQLIGNTTSTRYVDRPLTNNVLYCYRIKSLGTYGINGLPNPIENFSEEICTTPIDTSAPCIPQLTIDRNCVSKDPNGNVTNKITWTLQGTDSCFVDDVQSINIYFKTQKDATLTKLASITNSNINSYEHTPDSGFTGCYIVTATDKNNKKKKKLAESCPNPCELEYELPNSFSPNGDGKNDIFTPLKNSGVIKIKFNVFNRWGEKLFSTDNPAINWDGFDRNGKNLNDGVYYYTCVLQGFLQKNKTSVEERKGYIQIIH